MRVTRKIPLPVQYKEERLLACDACGREVELDGDDRTPLDWLQVTTRRLDGKGGIEPRLCGDFCPKCAPHVLQAVGAESKAIRGEKFVVAAETHGTGL